MRLIAITAGLLLASTALAASETASSRGSQQCDTSYGEHGVYESVIVYMIDEVVEGPLFLPIDSDRNTFEYRESAYHFFRDRFGVDFDAGDPGIQVISGPDGSANVFPLKTGEGSTHQVYGIDAQNISQWRHKMPMTKIALFDDGYFVTLDTDYVVRGSYGGEEGIVLPAGTQFVFGEYRMFDDQHRLIDTLRYRPNIPVTAGPVGGSFAFSEGAVFINIACDIESDIFGAGDVRSLAQLTPLPDGRTDLDFRYVMRFPSRLADAPDVAAPKCKTIRPLRRHKLK